jgi:menaquinone-dependent protoporphyrinogen oxidase
MKILIIYHTTYGCTEKCSNSLAEYLSDHEVLVYNLTSTKKIDIKEFNVVIIGASIRIGRVNRKVKQFCNNHLNDLLQKKIGLFICCMNSIGSAKEYLKSAFPSELQQHAVTLGYFGGELKFEEMTFFERSIIKEIAKTDKSVSLIKNNRIKKFASLISNNP